jgi:hypothetical protein
MKFPKMPKLPTWGWIVLVLVAVWYVFVREGVDATLKSPPSPSVVKSSSKEKSA